MSGILAFNLAVLATNETSTPLKEIPAVFHRLYLINFGTGGAGVMIWNDTVIRFSGRIPIIRSIFNVAKFKRRIENLNMGSLRGSRLSNIGLSLQYKSMDVLFWLGSRNIFRNRGFHISRAKEAVERK